METCDRHAFPVLSICHTFADSSPHGTPSVVDHIITLISHVRNQDSEKWTCLKSHSWKARDTISAPESTFFTRGAQLPPFRKASGLFYTRQPLCTKFRKNLQPSGCLSNPVSIIKKGKSSGRTWQRGCCRRGRWKNYLKWQKPQWGVCIMRKCKCKEGGTWRLNNQRVYHNFLIKKRASHVRIMPCTAA